MLYPVVVSNEKKDLGDKLNRWTKFLKDMLTVTGKLNPLLLAAM
jgi:hypothetical protein